MSHGKQRPGRTAGSGLGQARLCATLLFAFCCTVLPARLAPLDVGLFAAQQAFARDGESGSDHDSENSGRDGNGRGRGGDRDRDEEDSDRHGSHRNASGRSVSAFVGLLTGKGKVVGVRKSANSVEIEFADGWHERIQGKKYLLIDNKNRVVTSRPATDIDFRRLRAAERRWEGK